MFFFSMCVDIFTLTPHAKRKKVTCQSFIRLVKWFLDHTSQVSHHRELSVSKPHDPASPVGGTTPTAHPPGYDPAGPPRETSQLPKHQSANAEASAILLGQTGTWWHTGQHRCVVIMLYERMTGEKLIMILKNLTDFQ